MITERTITTQCGTKFRAIDNGAPAKADYLTLVFLHGWGMPSAAGIAHRIAEAAHEKGVRFVGINRRGYAGSTPYSQEEERVFAEGSADEKNILYRHEGRHYAYLLDALIKDHTIGKGGAALIAWSAGNAYLSTTIDAINDVPGEVRERLSAAVNAFIYYDPPPEALAIPRPQLYTPATDELISPADRWPTHLAWFASYFNHDLASRHEKGLGTRPDPSRTPSDKVDRFYEELCEMSGAIPGDANIIGPDFAPFIRAARDSAFFSERTWEAWGEPKISYVWAGASVWMMVYGVWAMEDLVKKNKPPTEIPFKIIEQGNHYSLFDHPRETLECFLSCAE
ncbi:alpha/beta-hydrolase [Schizophyllum commune Loenen D]|nr:alpha/beta-hydrolase [Schizophyllum commune Loenen D]